MISFLEKIEEEEGLKKDCMVGVLINAIPSCPKIASDRYSK